MSKVASAKKSKSPTKKKVYYDDKCSKLEILLTYNGRNETISVDNKENLSSIKDKVYNIFYPIQGKFQLIYKNKDISPFEDIPLYKYFKNLMKVSIIINPISSTNKNIMSKNVSNSFNSSFQDLTVIDKNEMSLGNVNQSQISNAQNILIEKDRMICNECQNKLINSFCRNCSLFLCKNCSEKYSSPHRVHSIVPINVSQIEKSAKSYKEIVSKECFNSGKKLEEYNNSINNSNNENENEVNEEKKEKKDIDGWLNDMNAKIESLSETMTKSDEINANTNFTLQDEESNYDNLLKKLQKINTEKSNKDLETFFNEMHEMDLNIKTIDNNLEQCINNSENSKTNNKLLKDLNKNLDSIINKLVKSLDKTNENSIDNI
jgi:hypothetical protein